MRVLGVVIVILAAAGFAGLFDAPQRFAQAAEPKAKGKIHLKVDLALPTSGKDATPLPGTLKEGWIPFCSTRWADMYMHDGVWEGPDGNKSPKGLGGTGVHVRIDCGAGGSGGFHVYGMCRDNLGGGGRPNGKPKGDPIANGWFHDVDMGGEDEGDIPMIIEGLPAGEYEVTLYHNHWEPRKQSSRNCLDQSSKMPPMFGVFVSAQGDTKGRNWRNYNWKKGTGKGVTPIKEAKNIKVTSVTSDDKVAKSLVRFKTDGTNGVLLIIEGGDSKYPDPARKGREGHKGILNAFEIHQVD